MKFPYYKLPNLDSRKKSLSVPWVEVTIHANDTERRFLMLVDSGADYCIFDKDIASFLGLNMDESERIKTGGISGETNVYFFNNIHINIGGQDINIRCGFIDGYLKNGKIAGILGRQGFFDHFKVCIDETKKEIELKSKT